MLGKDERADISRAVFNRLVDVFIDFVRENIELKERLAEAETLVKAWDAALEGDSDIWNHAPEAARLMTAYRAARNVKGDEK